MRLPILRASQLAVMLGALAFGAAAPALAADPATRLIVGFQAGGGLDSVARTLAEALSKTDGRTVIVENKPGASGIIAIDTVRKAAAGDAVLIIAPSTSLTMSPHTNRSFTFDPKTDLVPVARVATYSLALAVSPTIGVDTPPAYLERGRKDANLRTFGTAGIGLSPHYIGVTLAEQAKLDLVHVPYKGAGPAINDALGGQIPAVISTTPSLLAMSRDGRLKLLATTSTGRDPNTPDVPSFKELGIDGLELEEWFGVFAPAGTTAEDAQRWNAAINKALESEAMRRALTAQGFTPAPTTQAAFNELVIGDYESWRQALKDAGDTFAN